MRKKGNLYIRPDSREKDGFKYYFTDKDIYHMTYDEDIKIGEIDVSFQPPDMSENELRIKAIETLRDKQKTIRANAEKAVTELQDKINSLMLLTHQPRESDIEGEVL